MNKLQTLIAASLLCIASSSVYAAPSDVPGGEVPPAQNQKEIVPNNTENGNYLETQPADATTDSSATSKHNNQNGKDKKMNSNSKMNKDKKMNSNSKMNKDKKMKTEGKNTTEDPTNGGADVKTK